MTFSGTSRRLRILTWHIHGSYLYYLTQCPHEFFLPFKEGRPYGYAGRTDAYPWPDNVHQVRAGDVAGLELDCILFQSRQNYLEDQYEILSPEQRRLPRLYLEHDPPREHPTDTRHPVDDPEILLIHVTHFNNLMWDSGRAPCRVIEHGVLVPESARYTGEIERGLVVVNNLQSGGRRLGLDIFETARTQVPLDLAGINSEQLGGLGSLTHRQLLELEGRYRFIFNPIRYASLGLAICEAMMIGMPIVGLATTEMVTTIESGLNGYIDTDPEQLVLHMNRLLSDPEEARLLGRGARREALKRFNIQRFILDWDNAFDYITEGAAGRTGRRPQEILYS